MAKEGIRAITRVAAKEWGRFGIRINVICPFGDSPSAIEFTQDHPEAARAIVRSTPLGRMGDCRDDVGRAVAVLVGDDMGYLTGATLMLDGGLCIRATVPGVFGPGVATPPRRPGSVRAGGGLAILRHLVNPAGPGDRFGKQWASGRHSQIKIS